jgi:transposase
MSSSCWCQRSDPVTCRDGQSRILQGFRYPKSHPSCGPVFFPPYSSDLNPIEQVFAKLKMLLRKAEERTIDGVWRQIGNLLQHFTPQERANYLRNAGYASV